MTFFVWFPARRTVLASLFFVLLCVTSATAFADEPGLREDPALRQKMVTVYNPRLCVGELLELWSAQTGVSLSATERDHADREPVAAFVKDTPLADAMDSLRSLLSYKNATWRWERIVDASGRRVRYELHQSEAALRLPEGIQRQIADDFNAHCEALMAGLNATDEQKRRLAQKDPSAALLLTDPHVRMGIEAFVNVLTAEQRHDLFAEPHKRIIIDLQTAPSSASLLRDREMEWRKDADAANSQYKPEAYTHLHFKVDNDELTPTAYLLYGNKNGGEGNGVMGGMPFEKKWLGRLTDLWMLTGDAAHDAVEGTVVPKMAAAGALTEADRTAAELERIAKTRKAPEGRQRTFVARNPLQAVRLWQFALAARQNILMRLPPERADRSSPSWNEPYGKKAEAFLAEAEARSYPHKWRNGLLLVGCYVSLGDRKLAPDTLAPWATVKALRSGLTRRAAADPAQDDTTFTLDELAQVAASTTPEQLTNLATFEFSNVGAALGPNTLFRQAARQPDLFARLQTEQGVPFADVSRALVGFVDTAKARQKMGDKGIPERVRMREAVGLYSIFGMCRQFTVEALNADGTVVAQGGVFQVIEPAIKTVTGGVR